MKATEVLRLVQEITEEELLHGVSEGDKQEVEDKLWLLKDMAGDIQEHVGGTLWYRVTLEQMS